MSGLFLPCASLLSMPVCFFIMEKIKPIKGFPEYTVSECGLIESLKKNREKYLKPQKYKNGYLFVSLCKDGKVFQFLVHRIVANNFIPNIENKPQVNHKDGNKQNNHVDNLEWCTARQNTVHAVINKLRIALKGEETKISKLKTENINEIFSLIHSGISQKEIAKIYNVSPSLISKIFTKKIWKHV